MKIRDINLSDTGKRIFIEIGAQLQIEIEGVAFRFKSSVVGIEPNEYLIIKTPIIPHDAPFGSIKHKLFPGNQIAIRYLHKGTVFGFQSKLIEAISTPIRLLFVEFPDTVEHYDLRSHERIDCFLPTRIKMKDKERKGIILDITEKGCRHRIKALEGEKLPPVKIDEHITLFCQFPGIEGEHVVSGIVKNINKDKQEMALGIVFDEITPEAQKILTHFISTAKEIS